MAPLWVWLAFGETPTISTLIGAIIVFAAVGAHMTIEVAKSGNHPSTTDTEVDDDVSREW